MPEDVDDPSFEPTPEQYEKMMWGSGAATHPVPTHLPTRISTWVSNFPFRGQYYTRWRGLTARPPADLPLEEIGRTRSLWDARKEAADAEVAKLRVRPPSRRGAVRQLSCGAAPA